MESDLVHGGEDQMLLTSLPMRSTKFTHAPEEANQDQKTLKHVSRHMETQSGSRSRRPNAFHCLTLQEAGYAHVLFKNQVETKPWSAKESKHHNPHHDAINDVVQKVSASYLQVMGSHYMRHVILLAEVYAKIVKASPTIQYFSPTAHCATATRCGK